MSDSTKLIDALTHLFIGNLDGMQFSQMNRKHRLNLIITVVSKVPFCEVIS